MENKYSKPGFDGRLKYYDHLKSYWDRLADCSFNNDYPSWKKTLRGYYSRTSSFIREEDRIKVKTLFKLANGLIVQMNQYSNEDNKAILLSNLLDKLQDIEDLLFSATKDMLVATKESDEDDDFDMASFLKESD